MEIKKITELLSQFNTKITKNKAIAYSGNFFRKNTHFLENNCFTIQKLGRKNANCKRKKRNNSTVWCAYFKDVWQFWSILPLNKQNHAKFVQFVLETPLIYVREEGKESFGWKRSVIYRILCGIGQLKHKIFHPSLRSCIQTASGPSGTRSR